MTEPVTLGPLRAIAVPVAASAPAPEALRNGRTGTAPAAEVPANLPRLVAIARELARQGPPIDYARIAQVRQAIALDSAAIDVDRLARAMLGFSRRPSEP